MHKSNLNIDESGGNYYRSSGARGHLQTSRRRSSKMEQRNTSSLAVEPLVLIVDDNEDDRILMSRALLQDGFRVAEATTGSEAVTAVQDLQPQVVLLDLFMHQLGGLGACRLIRAEPEGANILIIMQSGLQDAGTIRRAYDAGASDFLPKPSVGSTLEDYLAMAKRVRYLLRNQHHTAVNGID